jgi:hypothetical protein
VCTHAHDVRRLAIHRDNNEHSTAAQHTRQAAQQHSSTRGSAAHAAAQHTRQRSTRGSAAHAAAQHTRQHNSDAAQEHRSTIQHTRQRARQRLLPLSPSVAAPLRLGDRRRLEESRPPYYPGPAAVPAAVICAVLHCAAALLFIVALRPAGGSLGRSVHLVLLSAHQTPVGNTAAPVAGSDAARDTRGAGVVLVSVGCAAPRRARPPSASHCTATMGGSGATPTAAPRSGRVGALAAQ